MAVQPDQRYRARLRQIIPTMSAKGSFGFSCIHQTEAGTVPGEIWITTATRDRARESLIAMGATEDELRDPAFMDAPEVIVNRADYSVVTEQHEYDGHRSVRVKWINPLVKKAPKGAGAIAAALLNGEPAPDAPTQIDENAPF